jgi:NADH-quinone oxidoreductase subunit H
MSGALAAADPTLSDFNQEIWWLVLLKVGIVFLFLLLTTIFMIWFERRVIGRMQNRPGPNRAGPWGLLQPIADALKLPLKEDIVPTGVDKLVFFVAPILACAPAFVAFAIIPWGPEASIFHHQTPLQVTDLPVAVLLVLATSSVGVYGIVLAGWASRGPYSILGALRSTAQVISYEIAMALSFVAVFLTAGTLSTSGIVNAQANYWYAWTLIPSFLIYLVTMVGETNRIPFDLPEGEGEIVAGHMTEYSSMKFAMFFLAEYINMTTVSALATTLFLGGWRPFPPLTLLGGWVYNPWVCVLWFLIKVFTLLFCYVWLRGTLPRTRYDQLMALGWKILIPFSIIWLLMVATVEALHVSTWHNTVVDAVGGMVLVLFLLLALFWDNGYAKWRARLEPDKPGVEDDEDEWDYDDQGELVKVAKPARPEPRYPVPPLDLPHYHGLELGDTALTGSTYGDADDATKEVTGV